MLMTPANMFNHCVYMHTGTPKGIHSARPRKIQILTAHPKAVGAVETQKKSWTCHQVPAIFTVHPYGTVPFAACYWLLYQEEGILVEYVCYVIVGFSTADTLVPYHSPGSKVVLQTWLGLIMPLDNDRQLVTLPNQVSMCCTIEEILLVINMGTSYFLIRRAWPFNQRDT